MSDLAPTKQEDLCLHCEQPVVCVGDEWRHTGGGRECATRHATPGPTRLTYRYSLNETISIPIEPIEDDR